MIAQGIKRVVLSFAGQGGGINITSAAKFRIFLSHFRQKRLEKAHLDGVIGHLLIIRRITVQRAVTDVRKNAGKHIPLQKIPAFDGSSVSETIVSNMRQNLLVKTGILAK